MVAQTTTTGTEELLPWLDSFDTAPERLLLTIAAIVLFALAVFALRRGANHVEKRYDSQLGDVAAGVVSILLSGGVGVILVWMWDVTPAVEEAVLRVGNPYEIAARVLITFALFVGLYVLTGVVRSAVNELAESNRGVSRHESEIVYRLAQVTIYIFGLLIALGTWEVDLSGFLVGAGFLGIVIGMAARQTLGALIAGFVLMFSRPFEIGDWVQVGDKDGIVTDITIVNTRLQTVDGEYVMLPNDVVSSNDIVNRSRKGRLRVHVEVGVDYEADVERAAEIAEETMGELDELLSVPRPRAVLKEFGDSAVIIGLRFWIDKPSARRRWRAQTAVIAGVKRAFEEENVKIPFPQRELTGRAESGGFEIADTSADVSDTDRSEPDGGENRDGGDE